MLSRQCQACYCRSGLDLTTLEDDQSRQSVVACMEAVKNLKRNGSYRRLASTGDGWLDFYLADLLWASHMIRTAYPSFMEDFADGVPCLCG